MNNIKGNATTVIEMIVKNQISIVEEHDGLAKKFICLLMEIYRDSQELGIRGKSDRKTRFGGTSEKERYGLIGLMDDASQLKLLEEVGPVLLDVVSPEVAAIYARKADAGAHAGKACGVDSGTASGAGAAVGSARKGNARPCRPGSAEGVTSDGHALSDRFPNLPVKVIQVLPPEDKRTCPGCGEPLSPAGKRVTQRLDFIPGKFVIRQYEYITLACASCRGADCGEGERSRYRALVEDGPAPVLLRNGQYDYGLIYHVIAEKFVGGMPLYRLERYFEDVGVRVGRNVMANWIIRVSERLEGVYRHMKARLRDSVLVNMDETPLQVHREEGRKNTTKSYLWLAIGRGEQSVAVFHYAPTRGASVPRALLGDDFSGTIQTDGYSAYKSFAGKTIPHVSCLAHIRRRFWKYEQAGELLPGDIYTLAIIRTTNAVFAAHASIVAMGPLPAEQVIALKKKLVGPLLDKLEKLLLAAKAHMAKMSLYVADVDYALSQLPGQFRYLEDAVSAPDNNLCEREIKGIVIGRKNWLFADSPEGARAIAIFASIVASARINDVSPRHYLDFVLRRAQGARTPEELEAMMPWNFIDGDAPDAATKQD